MHYICKYANISWPSLRKSFWTDTMCISVMCTTSIFLYACESWTLTAELQRRIQAMEMRCYRKILHISCKDHVTNEEVHAKIQQARTTRRPPDDRKETQTAVVWSCFPLSGLAKTILKGTVKGGRRQGGQRKRWEDNIRK